MKVTSLAFATVALAVAGVVDAATAEQWRSRSIYQLLTDRFARTDGSTTAPCNTADGDYCGGTWQGIIGKLDYIQGMGFTAIWISPVTYNIPERTAYGYGWHGYWQQDLFRLNDNFGTADDLKALSKALHDRNMYLMVDVVTNHNGWPGASNTVDYSKFNPFNDEKYYHSYCSISDYSNQTMVEDCWIGDSNVELPDLRTEDEAVLNGYNAWITELVSNYSIDGLRIDTAKYVDKPFWTSFSEAAGIFTMGEVFATDAGYTCDYQNYLASVLNIPLYFPMLSFLNSTRGTTAPVLTINTDMDTSCKDTSVLGVFSESHDVPRFASQTPDLSLAKNALAFTVLWHGIPIVYAGQEQHYSGSGDPSNREATWLSGYNRQSELYAVAAAANQVRSLAMMLDPTYATSAIVPLYSTTDTLVTSKGSGGNQVIAVFTNVGSAGPTTDATLNVASTGWTAGTAIVEALTCEQGTIGASGALQAPAGGGLPLVYVSISAAIEGGICNLTTASTGTQQTVTTNRSASMGTLNGRRKGRKRTVAAAGVVAAAAAAGVMG